MALEIVSALTAPITEGGKWLIRMFKRQIFYFTNYRKNLENLQSKVSDLQTKRNDIVNMLEEAGKRLEEPYGEVVAWLKKMDRIEEVVARLNEELVVNKKCLNGLCPDLGSRLRISKQALQTLDEVRSLEKEGYFRKVSLKRPLPTVEAVQVDWVEGFPSRDVVMNEVMEALHDKSIGSIGVYGMGGSGKTTLMKSLNNKLMVEKLFSKVIMVTVSQDPDLNKLQDNIASRLGLKFDPDDSDLTRANKLFITVKKEEQVLMILDDLWKELDVAKIGLPAPGNGECNGCKIIITTRIYDVCIKMKIETRVELKLLSEPESWMLFEAKAGKVVTLPMVKPLALEIVTRCKGSPLAICALASSLSEVESIGRWRHALKVLKNPYPGGVEGVMQEVASSIRYSYDHLPGTEIKLCFLFCCLYPEDYNIDMLELRNHGIAEGFLNANSESLDDASDEILDYVEKLKNSGMLLNGDEEGCIKMHDVVRNVGIWIASADENGFLVKIGGGSKIWADVEKLSVYKRISFMNFENCLTLSVPSGCRQLKLRSLLIRGNEFVIDHVSFFDRMKALIILDMRCELKQNGSNRTYSFSIPESLAHLSNLKALYLVRCDLSSKVSVLGGILNLEMLCLRESRIADFPEQIGNLTKLKCLDLTKAELSSVAPNVLSRLSNLEELLAWNDFEDWNMEVASLVHLSRLEIRLRDEKFNVPSFPWKNLQHFHLAIDFDDPVEQQSRYKNTLHLGKAHLLTHWASKPLSMITQRLLLDSCIGFGNIVDICVKGGFKNLEFLEVDGWKESEYIISIEEEEPNIALHNALQELKIMTISSMKRSGWNRTRALLPGQLRRRLELYDLPQLKTIWKGVMPYGSLQNLVEIKVRQCDRLEYLLLHSMAKGLQNLEDLSVSGCDGMENLVLSRREEGEATRTSYSRQREITGMSMNYSILNSPCPTSPTFQNLRNVGIVYCKRLKKIFSYQLAQSLQHLVHLEIHHCDQLECIIGKEEEEAPVMDHSQGLLPQLMYLWVENLPSLTSIYQGSLPLHSPNLKSITVQACPKLKMIPLGPESLSTRIDGEIERDERVEGVEGSPLVVFLSCKALLFRDDFRGKKYVKSGSNH